MRFLAVYTSSVRQAFYKWIFCRVCQISFNLTCTFAVERALFLHYFFIVSINHLFYNLDSGEKKKLFCKKSEKNLKSWILKSV